MPASKYLVSTSGKVMNPYTGRLLKPCRRGRVDIGNRTMTVARLMLLAFIGPPPTPGHVALRLCPTRNDLANVRWGTPSERAAQPHLCGRRRLQPHQVAAMRQLYAAGESTSSLACRFGCSASTVRRHLREVAE